jgi:hypothetical protein
MRVLAVTTSYLLCEICFFVRILFRMLIYFLSRCFISYILFSSNLIFYFFIEMTNPSNPVDDFYAPVECGYFW